MLTYAKRGGGGGATLTIYVSAQVGCEPARTSKGTSSDGERALTREHTQQCMVRRVADTVAEEVVHFILGGVGWVIVGSVGCDPADDERVTGEHAVQDVRWEVEVSDPGRWLRPSSHASRRLWEQCGLRHGQCLRRGGRARRSGFGCITDVEAFGISIVELQRIPRKQERRMQRVLVQVAVAA